MQECVNFFFSDGLVRSSRNDWYLHICLNGMLFLQVEDAMMDVYDFVYEDVRSNTSNSRREELHTIHQTFLCCGKRSPFGEESNIGNEMCQSEMVESAKEGTLVLKADRCIAFVEGLPSGDPALSEKTHGICSHTDDHYSFLHGVWDDLNFVPLVLYPLQEQFGPKGQIYPSKAIED
ncbi:hypothetical protein JD844_021903 [Phrynosoma platyrhinos]|uniref:Uncharacterized protein n=1 Tax=Phrynosoma platyrhinos TaxID=52577 RepID=A0ABQ7SUA9_PHRPL|nr:hypothetical protein JD844_021903 [Phrynosoma platyrhinos]